MRFLKTAVAGICALSSIALAHPVTEGEAKLFVQAKAKNRIERTRIANAGIAIDGILSDSVTFLATKSEVAELEKMGVELEAIPVENYDRSFPASDSIFHDHGEVTAELDRLAKEYPAIAKRISLGKSIEGRDLAGIRISSNPNPDKLPTAVFLGCHHAREHLSVEIPLKLAQYLVANYETDKRVKDLIDTREIWIVPMVNPDGAEFDIATGSYRYWRKNRRKNDDGTYGVDLNRNYAKGFGGPGASPKTSSDVYHGPSAFSEPETLAVRDFVRSRKKATVLLSFHTFSELVLWPWGYTDKTITKEEDRKVFETMGKKMASWNKYTPQKSSELYVASGDTTDWAYDELGIFAFTFELSPSSIFAGGFYPGAKAIEPTFKANLEPALYLIEKAENPYGVLRESRNPLGVLD